MHLDQLDIPILAKARGNVADEMGEQVDAKRGVAGLKNGDIGGGIVDQVVMVRIEPGGADDDGDPGSARGGQRRSERGGRGKVDQHVRDGSQRRHVAIVAIDAAGQRHLRRFADDFGDRPPHAAVRAHDSDLRHDVVRFSRCRQLSAAPPGDTG